MTRRPLYFECLKSDCDFHFWARHWGLAARYAAKHLWGAVGHCVEGEGIVWMGKPATGPRTWCRLGEAIWP